MKTNEIEVNGVTYSRKLESQKDKPMVMVRQRDSGVHFGFLESEVGDVVTLLEARRVWYWKGAATLSQLATEGPKFPEECKMPAPVSSITVYGICEKLPVTPEAAAQLRKVPEWSA